ncbi:MAG TPA: hypothetical protein PKD83_03865 [Ignavibacteria bacterium]|nr:hypothetical protein [Ignavibacteria bacterium]
MDANGYIKTLEEIDSEFLILGVPSKKERKIIYKSDDPVIKEFLLIEPVKLKEILLKNN